MLDFLLTCLIIILAVPTFFITIIFLCIASGSSIDPDDNGLFKSKKKKESWRQEKLNKLEQ